MELKVVPSLLRKDFLINYSFLSLCIIVFCNLNAMMAMILGVKSLLTPILLGVSIMILGRALFYHKIHISKLLLYTFVFLGCYIYVALISLLIFPENLHQHTSLIRLFRNYFSSFIIIGAFFFGTKYFISRRGVKYLFSFLILLFFFTSFFTAFTSDIGVANLYVHATDSLREGSRQSGLFGNPNEAGNFSAYFLVLLLGGALTFKRMKLFVLSLTILAGYSIFVSFSKAAIGIGILTVILFMLFNLKYIFRIGNRNRFIFLMVIAITTTIGVLTFVNWDKIFSNFSLGQQKRALSFFLLLQGEVSERTTSDRTITFQQGWNLIKKSPIIGNGFGSFHRFADGKLQLGVHNTYLLILGESGIFPLLLFLGLLYLLASQSLKISDHGLRFVVLGFCLVFFVSVAAAGHNAMYDRVSNGLLGICIAIVSIEKEV